MHIACLIEQQTFQSQQARTVHVTNSKDSLRDASECASSCDRADVSGANIAIDRADSFLSCHRAEAPHHLCCPVTLDLIQDPVTLSATGVVYSCDALIKSFDPLSGLRVPARMTPAYGRELTQIESQSQPEKRESQIEKGTLWLNEMSLIYYAAAMREAIEGWLLENPNCVPDWEVRRCHMPSQKQLDLVSAEAEHKATGQQRRCSSILISSGVFPKDVQSVGYS